VPAVITSIRIESLRGIRSGAVEKLSLLSVLVGPNGSGKSTVLDALLLAGGGAPGDAVGRVSIRRVELLAGGRWLFWRGARTEKPTARIQVEIEGESPREVTLRLLPDVSVTHEEKLTRQHARAPYVEIESTLVSGDSKLTARTALDSERRYVFRQRGTPELKKGVLVRLVDPRPGGTHASLSRSYTDAVEDGRLPEVEQIVAEVVPGLTHIHNLTNEAGVGIVHLAFSDHSVPVAVAGDGIQTLVQVCFALAQLPGTTVLLEEPEATQHPRSIYQSGRAIAAAVKRGVQVILSTHSLDLIDALRAELGDDLPKLTVHHLACPDGALSVVRYSGSEVAIARDTIGEDLR
jgi:predicted ATPase